MTSASTDTSIDRFRTELANVDPAALTVDDRIALLDLFEKTIPE